MEKLANALFSMRGMAIGLVIFFCAIAKATFIESEETTQAAKLWVYNATWFEILLLFLSLSLIANIFRYKMWLREKMAIFAFHLAFLVIIAGAALTRFAGFEGRMYIAEGEETPFVISSEPYFYSHVNNGELQSEDSCVAYMAESYPNSIDINPVKFPGRKDEVTFEFVSFKSKCIDSMVIDRKVNSSVVDIVVDGQSTFLLPGDDMDVGGLPLAFSKQKVNGINIYQQGDSLVISAATPMQYIPMTMLQVSQRSGAPIPDSVYKSVLPNTPIAFTPKTLYMFAGRQFAFKQIIEHATKKLMPTGKKDRGSDYLTIRVKDGNKSKLVTLQGGIDQVGKTAVFEFNGLSYKLEFGSRRIILPFKVKCIDFILERYSGSDMASSYASDIIIKDPKNKVFKSKHLFMNHVVDYQGYRFFQSSYFPDESGTILSVNYDWWGTNVTYLGYLLMTIGMLLSLAKKGLRFRTLLDKLNKSNSTAILLAMMLVSPAFGQTDSAEHNHDHSGHDHSQHDESHHVQQQAPKDMSSVVHFISEEHSDELASLLVLDYQNRISPFHTLSDQLLRKLYGSNSFEEKNAVQVILAMHMYPDYWLNKKIIKTPAPVREQLHLGKYVSFKELTHSNGDFKWAKEYNNALQTPEVKQTEYQKKLIKLGEKSQVFLQIMSWQFFRIIPLKENGKDIWYSPISAAMQGVERNRMADSLTFVYLQSVDKSSQFPSNYPTSVGHLNDLKALQRAEANPKDLPSETQVKMEISYTKMQIFKNSEMSYFLLGVLLLLLFLLKELVLGDKESKGFKITRKIFAGFMMIIFLYHGYGLGVRAYISGHAPWSDGYEALIFIAWVTILAGFIFSRKNASILAGAALLAGSMIMVTELELLDPQITPLQPVLKSYWLKVHVAVITSSYAFLGLSCILGFINLVLYVSRGTKNAIRVTRNINELTYVSEMTMLIGCFMLTIGTFLGGVWANESWGRYWGWDPKETWALVSVLVYAIVLHLRFIPGLNGKFVFSMLSFWAYSAILFTFFGVNFILVGLHSYAQGDGSVALPSYIWYMVGIFGALTIWAGLKNKAYLKQQRASL